MSNSDRRGREPTHPRPSTAPPRRAAGSRLSAWPAEMRPAAGAPAASLSDGGAGADGAAYIVARQSQSNNQHSKRRTRHGSTSWHRAGIRLTTTRNWAPSSAWPPATRELDVDPDHEPSGGSPPYARQQTTWTAARTA